MSIGVTVEAGGREAVMEGMLRVAFAFAFLDAMAALGGKGGLVLGVGGMEGGEEVLCEDGR